MQEKDLIGRTIPKVQEKKLQGDAHVCIKINTIDIQAQGPRAAQFYLIYTRISRDDCQVSTLSEQVLLKVERWEQYILAVSPCM